MKFYKLFSVKFSHEYFSDRMFEGLRVLPAAASAGLMKSYGILQKKIGNEYLLAYKDEDPGKSLLTKLSDPLLLSFYIFCEDAFLLNYSDLPVDAIEEGFLLTNRYAGTKENGFLHKNDFISTEEKVVFVNSYNALESSIKEPEQLIAVTTTDPVKGTQQELFKGKSKDLKTTLSFVTLLEAGYFEIKADAKTSKYYATTERTGGRLFGVLQILLTPELIKAGGVNYLACIGAKEVVWRYHLVNREQVSYKEFKLYSGKTIVPIQEEVSLVLDNGENAYLLETTDPIVMAERYENFYELEFVREDLKTGQVLSKKRMGLPVPEISRIKISKTNDSYKAFSDMYIYL